MINAFFILLWLELRKFGWTSILLILAVGVIYMVASSIPASGQGTLLMEYIIVLSVMLLVLAVHILVLAVLGWSVWREHQSGRLGWMLSSPQPAWLQILARAVFGAVILTLFNCAAWAILSYRLHQAGVGLPFELGLGLWLYLLGGLALVGPVLLLSLWIAAYNPSKATLMAFVVGLLGMGQLLAWGRRILEGHLYGLLPPWRLPAPTFSQNQGGPASFPGLPSEGFVLLAALTALSLYLAHRLWQEMEA